MATFIVSTNDDVKINFAPSTTVEEVLQNVRTIINTIKWQIPLARDIGISGDIIDMPLLQAKARYTQDIIQSLKRYEPRAQIQKVEFNADVTGKLTPRIEVKIIESD